MGYGRFPQRRKSMAVGDSQIGKGRLPGAPPALVLGQSIVSVTRATEIKRLAPFLLGQSNSLPHNRKAQGAGIKMQRKAYKDRGILSVLSAKKMAGAVGKVR